METKQEPKYEVTEEGKLRNRQSKKLIPDDEPVFILRGRDRHAVSLLRAYAIMVVPDQKVEHIKAVASRIAQFEKFAAEHADRMKVPDTKLTSDWDNL